MTSKLLVVDDEPEIVALVTEYLNIRGYEVRGCTDPHSAIPLFRSFSPDICIFDFNMPGITGGDLLKAVKVQDDSIEVIFLTAADQTSLAVHMMKQGAFDYLLKPIVLDHLAVAISRAIQHRNLVLENRAYKLHLKMLVEQKTNALNRALRDLNHMHGAILDTLSTALDFRDQGTSGHSRRVAELTSGIARGMGITGDELVQIEHGALLHDLGKLKIPDSILWKPAQLTESEWQTMRRHAEYGFEFLNNVDFLKPAAEIVYSHHERFDGSGYPRQLKGEGIPVGARVFAIVDAVDAMTYPRPYHAPISLGEALAEVRRCAGTHFDPALVEPATKYLASNSLANHAKGQEEPYGRSRSN